jgi:TonB family protein
MGEKQAQAGPSFDPLHKDANIDKLGVHRTMRRYVVLVFIFVVIAEPKRGMAADSAAALIADVAQKVRGAAMWESEGLLVTESTHSNTQSRTELPFRVSVENARDASTTARARLEVTGGSNPLVRVCAGGIQWNYLVLAKRYWKTTDQRIDACAYPFTEWRDLASDLHSPTVVGEENLKVPNRTIKCTIVRGDFAAHDPVLVGSRTLWIDELSKMVWRYRIERPSGDSGEPAARLVQNYTLFWQTRAGLRRSDDLWEFQPDEGAKEVSASSAKLEAADPLPPMTLPVALPKSLYRIGGKVSPPVLIHKVEPVYPKTAQRAKIEGRVILSAEVRTDGKAYNLQVVQSLDPDLDLKAIDAVTQWRFHPGVRDGSPVAVLATFEVNFKLR